MLSHVRNIARIGVIVGITTTAVSAWPVAKLTWQYAITRLTANDDAEIIAELALHRLSLEDYEREIDAALGEQDPELARSIVQLAQSRGISMPAGVEYRVSEVESFSISRTASEAWLGLSEGSVETPTALVGSTIADMTAVGDARDLWGEIEKGEDYDPLTLSLSAAGLAATAATFATGPQGYAVRAGATFVKSLKKAGTLPKTLQKELTDTLAGAIDTNELARARQHISDFEVAELAATAKKLVKPAAMKKLEDTTRSLGIIVSSNGYRATVQSLKVAETMDDLRRIEKLSDRFGNAFRGVLRFVAKGGGFAVRFGAFLLSLGWEAIAAVIWLLCCLAAVIDALAWIFRALRRLFAPAVAAPTTG